MRKFGLIGYPLGHSFSRGYFARKFQSEGLNDCAYLNFELASLALFPEIVKDPELQGLNVTIPYKQEILGYLQGRDAVVSETGACNCVHIKNGSLFGYNTDVTGFEESLKEKLTPAHDRALVLGTGGSSKAVAYVLKNLGIPFQFVSRRMDPERNILSYEMLTGEMVGRCRLIINCTPLGMTPMTGGFPLIPYGSITGGHYLFDLVYNPSETLFLQKGAAQGATVKNGADMLVLQAEASWRLWNV
jgi:shikimate dehydrogenase